MQHVGAGLLLIGRGLDQGKERKRMDEAVYSFEGAKLYKNQWGGTQRVYSPLNFIKNKKYVTWFL